MDNIGNNNKQNCREGVDCIMLCEDRREKKIHREISIIFLL